MGDNIYRDLWNYQISIAELKTLFTMARVIGIDIIYKDERGGLIVFFIPNKEPYDILFDDENRYIVLKQIDKCPVVNSVKVHDDSDHYLQNAKFTLGISVLNFMRKQYANLETFTEGDLSKLLEIVRHIVHHNNIEDYVREPVQILPRVYDEFKQRLYTMSKEIEGRPFHD